MVFVPLKGDADDSVRFERAIYPTKWPASECKAELVFISDAQMAIQHTIHLTFVWVFECLGMLQSPRHTLLPRIDLECIRKMAQQVSSEPVRITKVGIRAPLDCPAPVPMLKGPPMLNHLPLRF